MELRERCASWRLGITLEVRAHRGLVELGAIFERDGGLGAPSIVWAGIGPYLSPRSWRSEPRRNKRTTPTRGM